MEKRNLAAHGLRLCDITINFPDLKIASAKRILSYIHAVEQHEFSIKATDDQTEMMLRQALDLPNDQKNVLGLIRNLGVGAYRARQLVTILRTFQGGGFETPAITVRSILSDSYGRYSPYDERPPRRQRPPDERGLRRDMRAEEYLEREYAEEPEEEPRRPLKRYGREPEPPRQRQREPQERERPPKGREAPQKEVPSDLVGRRCLFHGGIAVARCGKCKAVLCKECIRGSDRCPRCNTPLGPVVEQGERRKPVKERRGEEYEEEPEEVEEERPTRRGRELERSQKKKRDEQGDLSRL
jgi:hypothetical protein